MTKRNSDNKNSVPKRLSLNSPFRKINDATQYFDALDGDEIDSGDFLGSTVLGLRLKT